MFVVDAPPKAEGVVVGVVEDPNAPNPLGRAGVEGVPNGFAVADGAEGVELVVGAEDDWDSAN